MKVVIGSQKKIVHKAVKVKSKCKHAMLKKLIRPKIGALLVFVGQCDAGVF